MIDNREMEKVLEHLEQMEDQAKATRLLKEFNDKSAELGQLLLNLDPNLDNEEWKSQCDKAQEDLERILEVIFQG